MSTIEQEVRNQTLNEAIQRIEGLHGNEKYEQAWRRAIAALRKMIVQGTEKVPDKAKQISSISARPV